MKAKIGIGLKVYNVFEFELKNTVTGDVKRYKSHNIVLDNFTRQMVISGSNFNISAIPVGTGTGVISPTRTALFNQIISPGATRQAFSFDDDPAWARYTATLTETQGNGNLTEVGLSAGSGLFTHSMITDAEGNPISIPKTNVDILTITATIYGSFEAVNTPGIKVPKFPAVIQPVPQGEQPHVINDKESMLLRLGIGFPINGLGVFTPSTTMVLGTYHKTNHIENNGWNVAQSIFSIGPNPIRDAALGRVRVRVSMGSAQGNLAGGPYLIKAIRYRNLAEIQFPNYDIFPRRAAEFIAGVGDGIKTGFNINLPQCNVGDEEVYIDNVLQDPSTYDFSGKNMAYTQAWRSSDIYFLMEGSGYVETRTGGVQAKWPFFPMTTNASAPFLWSDEARPFIYDFEQPVKINRLQGNAAALSNLEYSHDLVTWTRVITNQINVDFDTVEARYWKFWNTTVYLTSVTVASSATSMLAVFDELRDGLIFDEPPPDGAVIRAVVTSDYPWKDSNWELNFETDFFPVNLSGA